MNKSVNIYKFKNKRANMRNKMTLIINYYLNCFNIQNECSMCIVR